MATIKNNEVSALCKRIKVLASVEVKLGHQVDYLRIFKHQILPNTPTVTERAISLKRIETLAVEMKKAVESLSLDDRLALDDEFFNAELSAWWNSDGGDPEAFDLAGRLLPRVAKSAISVRERIKGIGQPGAQKMTERQVEFIRCIAQAVKPAGIVPSLTGQFAEVCQAVYADAGLTVPERAMKFFMSKIRPKTKAAGYCL